MPEHSAEPFNFLPILMPLAGVLIGGGLTFGYQLLFRRLDRRRVRHERLNRFHRTTGVVFFDIGMLHKAVAELIPDGVREPNWIRLHPIVGHNTAPLDYSHDDLGVTGGPTYATLSQELVLIARERNALIATLAEYKVARKALLEALDEFTTITAEDMYVFDNAYKLNPKTRRLEVETASLADAIRRDLSLLWDKVYEVNPKYNDMIRALYGPKHKVGLELPKR